MTASSSRQGQTLAELLIAAGLTAIFMIGVITLVAPALRSRQKASNVEIGSSLGTELMDNLRAATDGNWTGLLTVATGTANKYFLNTSSSPFRLATGTQTISVGTTTVSRYFYISDAYRDSGGALTSTVINYDPSTKLVTVVYGVGNGPTSTIATYFTRSSDEVYSQGDWTGGAGDAGPITSSTNSYFSASGTIVTGALGSLYLSNFTASGTLQSPTFDTGNASGSVLHSILWSGSLPPGTAVGFQLAVSNSPIGPWSFKGNDGTSATYFSGSFDVPIPLIVMTTNYSAFSGNRYFRWQATLFPDAGHTTTPDITRVTVHWSQ